MDKEGLNIPEAAAIAGVGIRKMRELISSGQVPVVRLSERVVRVPKTLLLAWLQRQASTQRG